MIGALPFVPRFFFDASGHQAMNRLAQGQHTILLLSVKGALKHFSSLAVFGFCRIPSSPAV